MQQFGTIAWCVGLTWLMGLGSLWGSIKDMGVPEVFRTKPIYQLSEGDPTLSTTLVVPLPTNETTGNPHYKLCGGQLMELYVDISCEPKLQRKTKIAQWTKSLWKRMKQEPYLLNTTNFHQLLVAAAFNQIQEDTIYKEYWARFVESNSGWQAITQNSLKGVDAFHAAFPAVEKIRLVGVYGRKIDFSSINPDLVQKLEKVGISLVAEKE